jgi:putative addiction module antidote
MSGQVARLRPEEHPMYQLKLTRIGNSVGVVLPKELLATLKLDAGDVVFATDAPNGVTLTPYDPSIETQVMVGEAIMNKYRDVLKALAK